LLEHHVSMRLSRCYRASAGKLNCLTCHNPHEEPSERDAPTYFRRRCLTCHSESSCRVSLQARRHQEPADNCIGCHMPKRDVQKISHAALTNHRIPARPEEPIDLHLPGANSADLPGLLLLNASGYPAPEPALLPQITKLAVYGDLLNRDPNLQPNYLDLLSHLSRTMPDDPLVEAALGRKALLEMSAQAESYLSQAVAQDTPGPDTFLDLAEALTRQGRDTEATAAIGRGILLFPYSQILRKHQILRYIQAKDYARAEKSIDAYVSDFPEDSFMRKLLDQVRANRSGK
jgi:predicted Zn-dependent protease